MTSRRDILKLVGGGAVGFFLSPIPWKLFSDSAIWTQNWKWIPQPVHGNMLARYTACTLCPGGCGLKLQCVGAQPVTIAPAMQSTICPIGLAAHQLPYHPARLRGSQLLSWKENSCTYSDVSLNNALDEITQILKTARANGKTVAVLDPFQGRTISRLYANFLEQFPDGKYVYENDEIFDPAVLQECFTLGERPAVAVDLDRCENIVSLGFPLFEQWGRGREFLGRWTDRARHPLNIIQVEAAYSRTASLADRWVRITPDTEPAFVLGLLSIIQHQQTALTIPEAGSLTEKLKLYSPDFVSKVCRISPELLHEVAGRLTMEKSVVIPSPRASRALASLTILLNYLLGNFTRPDSPMYIRQTDSRFGAIGERLSDQADRSIDVLIIDGAQPIHHLIPLIERKVKENGTIISFSSFKNEFPRQTRFVIPSPVFLEQYSEVFSESLFALPSLSIGTQFLQPDPGCVSSASVMKMILKNLGSTPEFSGVSTEGMIKDRFHKIFESGKGSVVSLEDGVAKPLSSYHAFDDCWNDMVKGAKWNDESSRRILAVSGLLSRNFIDRLFDAADPAAGPEPGGSGLMRIDLEDQLSMGSAVLPPVLTKLYQESHLFRRKGEALVHPTTAQERRLTDGQPNVFPLGKEMEQALVYIDSTVPPESVVVCDGPSETSFL